MNNRINTVAIQLGSSRISGVAGYIAPDGVCHIIGYASEPSDSCIRHGAVYNLVGTTNAISEVISRLERVTDSKIEKAVVGIGGKSLKSVYTGAERSFESETIITQTDVDAMFAESEQVADGYCTVNHEPQEFFVNHKSEGEKEPVGVACTHLRGSYLSLIMKEQALEYIKTCLANNSLEWIDIHTIPLAEADLILSAEEKNKGCALINYGADTVSVSIYKGGMLRYLRVLPLGSNLITKDLAEILKIETEEAENLKRTYGMCCLTVDSEDSQMVEVNGQSVELRLVSDIIEARNEEIIGNIYAIIKESGYSNVLYSGMVLCGGGARLRRQKEAFEQKMSQLCPLRMVVSSRIEYDWQVQEGKEEIGTQNALLSLLSKNEYGENCMVFHNRGIDDLTEEKEKHVFTPDLFEDEAARAERENAARKRDEEEKEQQEEKEKEIKEKKEEKKRKGKNRLKNLFDNILEKSSSFIRNME